MSTDNTIPWWQLTAHEAALWRSFVESIDASRCFMCGGSPTRTTCCCPTSLNALMAPRSCVPALDVRTCEECGNGHHPRTPWYAIERWLKGGEQTELFA